ncbi:hypothetical protein PIB30_042213 [Stylosanthes scabra]|uniref:RNase H type-1 domain-containing protein n=1 Tax=Stylosanthes scabra TaxID=79078 RepID=A0ABU6WF44_9FABA|nr:hypothetical protein [Stylosanthes scabra]
MEALCTKELLRSRNIIPNGEVNCVLCGKEEENQEVHRKKRRKWLIYYFAVVWVVWRCRNDKIFENREIKREGAWEVTKSLVEQWALQKRIEVDRRIGSTRENEELNTKHTWWQCVVYKPEMQIFMVGGYLYLGDGRVLCLMSDIVDKKIKGEANIRGAADAVQFLIEEVEVREEEVMIILDYKDLVDWIQGKESTD